MGNLGSRDARYSLQLHPGKTRFGLSLAEKGGALQSDGWVLRDEIIHGIRPGTAYISN